MSERSMEFEKSIARLDEIVKQMEQGNVPLENALQLFEEGTKLVKNCAKQLDEAELKVVKLMKGADGNPVETEFESDGEV